MKKHLVRVILLLAASIMCASSVYAEVKFDYGADFRLRQEIWDDVVTLDTLALTSSGADRNFLRLRTRLWGKADFSNDFGAYARLTNEMKWYGLGPYDSFKYNPDNDKFDPDEIIIDNLYFDAKNLFGAVDLRIGRQDFIGTYGEGFLLMDGTPQDGSRTFYFNAAKANVKVSQNFNFDVTYITDPKTDIYLPSIHPSVTGFPGNAYQFVNNKKVLPASNEQAALFYGRGKIDNLTVEPYYIYKTEKGLAAGGIDPTRLNLHTFGARALYSIDKWNMGGEFAYQFGEYDDNLDRTGAGGYVFVGRKYDAVMWKPEFELRYVYLSGDKAGTKDKVETWDPLFSRNPYWNELIIYTLIPETSKYGG
ncbi:MAG TPA: alginate export family protein, partial [Thermodesulfovibrionales bacterium]|nr:alginate export family protein [Thermodesulfovibrionales bacterium]